MIQPAEDPERWQNFAKIVCGKCKAFMRWQPFPTTDAEEKRCRRKSRKALRPTDDAFCEVCLRTSADLTYPDKLEVQHVIEKADGGGDDPENLRVYCSMCHAMANWVRTYVSRREIAKREREK